MEVVLSVTPTLSSQIHGNIYIYIIYIYVVTIVLMISVRVFKSGFIFHSVGIRQNWAEKLRGFSDNK